VLQSVDGSLPWHKSSFSTNSCVEVAPLRGGVAIRDSKNPDGGILVYTPDEWRAFLAGVRNGEFDNVASTGPAS
jgi:hypothetical protein